MFSKKERRRMFGTGEGLSSMVFEKVISDEDVELERSRSEDIDVEIEKLISELGGTLSEAQKPEVEDEFSLLGARVEGFCDGIINQESSKLARMLMEENLELQKNDDILRQRLYLVNMECKKLQDENEGLRKENEALSAKIEQLNKEVEGLRKEGKKIRMKSSRIHLKKRPTEDFEKKEVLENEYMKVQRMLAR